MSQLFGIATTELSHEKFTMEKFILLKANNEVK